MARLHDWLFKSLDYVSKALLVTIIQLVIMYLGGFVILVMFNWIHLSSEWWYFAVFVGATGLAVVLEWLLIRLIQKWRKE